jgi:hypothetical protein
MACNQAERLIAAGHAHGSRKGALVEIQSVTRDAINGEQPFARGKGRGGLGKASPRLMAELTLMQ